MKQENWYFLIQGKYDNKGAIVNFYSTGDHLGDALNNVYECADKINISNCELLEASRLDFIEDFELPENTEKITEKVKYQNSLSLYEFEDEENFISPIGIVKSTEDGEYEFDLIKEQFVAYTKNENDIYSFTMTISKEKLETIFFKCVEFIPDINSICINLLDHWEEESRNELWINTFKNKKEILIFIKENELNLIQNGFIDIVFCCKKGETNLVLDEHKQICLTTKSEDIFNEFGKQIMNLGFQQTKELYSLENGYYHWHYRPSISLDKNQFRQFLSRNKFELKEK